MPLRRGFLRRGDRLLQSLLGGLKAPCRIAFVVVRLQRPHWLARPPPNAVARLQQAAQTTSHYAAAAATTDVDQSITDVGRTMCLLMPSSFGESPRASPTSCGRWRTGNPSSRPTTRAA